MPRHLLLGLAGALLLAPPAARTQTNGYLLGCSAAAPLGRGCTTLSNPGDPALMLANPAALATTPGRSLSVSGAAFLPSMSYSNAANPLTAGKDNVFPLPAVFFTGGGGDRPLAFGVGIQTLGGMGADYTLTHPLLGPGQRYHSKFGLMKGGVAAAYRVTPRLSLGAVAGGLYGQIEFATPYAVSPAQLAGLAGLAADPDYAPILAGFTEATAYASMSGLSGFGLTGAASAQYRLARTATLALTWTAPSTLTLGGGAAAMDMAAQFGQLYQAMAAAKGGDTATVNAQLAGMGIDFARGMATRFDAELDIGVPQTVTLALGAQPSPRVRLGVDVGWIGWSDAFRTMPVRLAGGTNPNINIMMNATPADGSFETAWPLAWKDAWTARAGAEVGVGTALVVRGGAMYGTNPVASDGLFTIFPAIVQGAGTLGAGYQRGRTTVDLTYAHTFAHSETAGSPHIVAAEYANSTSRLSENTLSFGIGWRF